MPWYGSRHYDPELGRFISPDSIVPLATQGVQAWDLYAYVNNSPTNYIDATGHITEIDRLGWRQRVYPALVATFTSRSPDMGLADPIACDTATLPSHGDSLEPVVHEWVVGCGVLVRFGRYHRILT